MATRKRPKGKYMTVRMLERELRTVRRGLSDVIAVLAEMDGHEIVTNISDDRIEFGSPKPWSCPIVDWVCHEKIWTPKQVGQTKMTPTLKSAIKGVIDGVIPCLGRVSRYMDKYTKDGR